ncbi:3-carboxyethylcatechol 2,3-dioxygenase [Pseudomonas sp. TTU2014-080ASC]|uniref:3-carboxyethylcatechol 2,3-dioxygenase n=1 Tax=Pseudomonas sp. TTU2014-080ASC TaxID=1729724 RepID=UPI0007188D6E|nr:3-carboxyethylcatechol 2,3-dioxygenase [Pseudomonas sp. TTU2014-080ASC]KRW61438.1 3-(2,3-dihydroxyphenyl)propionate dioxygenase [Pseudomonas sp. TTU2014-080ASC]
MTALLECLSHTPLVGFVDPARAVLDEVDDVISAARKRVAEFDPELVVLFTPDHYNGFFYDVMPSFCIGMAAHAIGDFGTLAGPLNVPQELAESCAQAVLDAGVDSAVSYRMQLDHGAAQPLELLFGGLREVPVIPVFINSVATPLPSFQRARLLGEAIGRWAQSLNQRVLFIASGGLSHQPPVPELAKVDGLMADRLKGSGRYLPADEREARTQRVILAAQRFVHDQNSLHPLNPEWDQQFLDILSDGRMAELDSMGNAELSALAGKSTHEVKTWVAASSALQAFGPYQASNRYYREIPEWIAGFGALSARPCTSGQ